jgi:subtilisin-like proprotein convertase family protein
MLLKDNWTARIAAIAGAGILAGICSQAGVADAKPKLRTTTFSSGDVNLLIPEPVGIQAFPISSTIRVKVRGRIKDVNVAVRITIPDDRDLELIVVGPTVKGARLKEHAFRNDPKGADFGTGPPSCAGTPTIFDSQATTPILQGLPPFAGSFVPSQSLNGLRRGRVDGKWSLELLDSFPGNIDGTAGAPGVLNCWKLTIRYRPGPRRR